MAHKRMVAIRAIEKRIGYEYRLEQTRVDAINTYEKERALIDRCTVYVDW